VEYHGPFVRIAMQDKAGAAHSLLLTEQDFYDCPVSLGEHVIAGFTPADAHLLAG
jgi:hypothetical protein